LLELIVQGDSLTAGGEELLLQFPEFFLIHTLSQRGVRAFFEVEFLGVVLRLELPLLDVGEIPVVFQLLALALELVDGLLVLGQRTVGGLQLLLELA
jgi:hypothetical protein